MGVLGRLFCWVFVEWHICWRSKQWYHLPDHCAQASPQRSRGVTLHPAFLMPVLMGSCYGRDPVTWFCEMFAVRSPSRGLEKLILQSEQKDRWHTDTDSSKLHCCVWGYRGLALCGPDPERLGTCSSHRSAAERRIWRENVAVGCLWWGQRRFKSSSIQGEGRTGKGGCHFGIEKTEGRRIKLC